MNITDNGNGLYTRETLARTDVSARTPSGRLRRWWSSMVSWKIRSIWGRFHVQFHGQLKDQKSSLQILNPSPPPPEMPSKIPTYSVFPNSDPDTEYEEDYETPAPGPPPTRSFALYTSWNQTCWPWKWLKYETMHCLQTSSSRNDNTVVTKHTLYSSSVRIPLQVYIHHIINFDKRFLSYFYVFGWKVLI